MIFSRTTIGATQRREVTPGQLSDWASDKTDFSLRAAVMIGLTFFPYLAIPAGNNTNIPLAALFAAVYTRELLARPRLLVPLLVVAFTPALMLFVQSVVGQVGGQELGVVVWMIHIAPLGGVAGAVVTSPRTVRLTLRIFLLAAAGYTVVQKFFLDSGTIPLLSLYEMPGYWSVTENAEVITKYVRRPFGWFPESSFMAGSLALAAMALVLLSYVALRRLPVVDIVAVAAVVVAMTLGESGSALLTVPVLAAMVFLPFSTGLRRAWFLLVGTGSFLLLAMQLLQARNELPNHSWDDRGSSIQAGINFLFDSLPTFLIGVGPGGASVLYENGKIPLDGLVVHNRLFDIFSVSVRVLLENGAVAGGVMILTLVVLIVRSFSVGLSWVFGLLAASAWLAVVTLTITYNSAAWLWAFPGVCLGVLVGFSERGNEEGSGQQ
jgi:hypothetical protein